MTRTLLVALALLLTTGAAYADPVVVVPGSNAGYLYFPASASAADEDPKQIVYIQKTGGHTDYTITSDPPGLVCDSDCTATEAELPLGPVTFTITGTYSITGGPSLPMNGMWSGGCNTTVASTACTVVLTAVGLPSIDVAVPSSPAGSEFELSPSGPIVRYAGYHNGDHLIVADRYKANGLRWVVDARKETSLGLTGTSNRIDGRNNMSTLLSSENSSEAALYCQNLSNTLPGTWYLPASQELALLLNFTVAQLSEMGLSNKTWASDEKENKKAMAIEIKISDNKYEVKDHDKSKTDATTLCVSRLS